METAGGAAHIVHATDHARIKIAPRVRLSQVSGAAFVPQRAFFVAAEDFVVVLVILF